MPGKLLRKSGFTRTQIAVQCNNHASLCLRCKCSRKRFCICNAVGVIHPLLVRLIQYTPHL
ncbi:hypothetical protein D3C75_1358720 [compost metagenome]